MKAESEIRGHRWWHGWFCRPMGSWVQGLHHAENGAPIYHVSREIHYCKLCREMFHHGTPMREQIDAFLKNTPSVRLLEPGGSACKVLPMTKMGLVPSE